MGTESSGRIITVKVYNLRVGDMFAGDSTRVTEVIRDGLTYHVTGTCHGIEKRRTFYFNEDCKLWETFKKAE